MHRTMVEQIVCKSLDRCFRICTLNSELECVQVVMYAFLLSFIVEPP